MASARPASAAAIVMMKIAKIMPMKASGDVYAANATMLIAAALSISSTDIRISTALRRVSTPYTPSGKDDRAEDQEVFEGDLLRDGGSFFHLLPLLPARDHDRADQRDKKHERRDLERHRPLAEQRIAERSRTG